MNQRRLTRVLYSAVLAVVLTVLARPAVGQIGTMEIVGRIGGVSKAVQVEGNYAYVVGRSDLHIFDVSNPSLPALCASHSPEGSAWEVAVVAETAYLVTATDVSHGVVYGRLEIVDVGDPKHPAPLGWLGLLEQYEVAVCENVVYTVGKYGGNIIDVSNPSWPWKRGTLRGGLSIDVDGNLACIAERGFAILHTYDVSVPTTPIALPDVAIAPIGGSSGVDIVGNLVHATSNYTSSYTSDYRFVVVDVSDAVNPRIVGTLNLPDWCVDVCVADGVAYVGTAGGIYIVDITSPPSPVLLGLYATPSGPVDIDIADGLIYAACNEAGLLILRHVPPRNVRVTTGDFEPAAPAVLQPGDVVSLSAHVLNEGDLATGTFWLEAWGSRTGGLMIDVPLTEGDLLGPLAVGQDASFSATKILRGVPDGPYTVVFYADRMGEVVESNECDNRQIVAGKRLLVLRPQTQADLVVEGFSLAPDPAWSGQNVQMTGQVRNAGAEATGEFWIEFWGTVPVGDNALYPDIHFMLCDSMKVDDLAPGAWVELAHHQWTLKTDLPSGTFWVGCFADRVDYVNELDETNNYQFVAGHALNTTPPLSAIRAHSAIRNQQSPDLVITYFDFEPAAPAQLRPGDNVRFWVWM